MPWLQRRWRVCERRIYVGDFLLEYKGQLIDHKDAEQREKSCSSQNVGCFMYYFNHGSKLLW